ncbi:MAG: hypothetical protein ACE5DX_01935 [Candidatus Dojkabacteria bacterium]
MRVPKLPRPTKDHLAMLIVSTIVVVISIAYLVLIGIPMTQARNEYNRGYRLYENGRLEQSREVLKYSLEIWYSDEAEELLETVSDRLGIDSN